MKTEIDIKIDQLQELTNEFLFIEYYSNTGVMMYKILNEYTKWNQEKVVLCPVSDGIEQALYLAIKTIKQCQKTGRSF